ncbi:MAG: hypothetical protein KDD25_09785 [Bdellovibrionales bacterium]|nr:hypothetical protein [Bdellovibrionales bacterium]
MTKKPIDDEVWVDYIEDELDPSLKDDLDTYISHSPDLDGTVRDLQFARTQLEKIGSEVEIPEDEKFYENLHDKIMARVEKTNVQSPVVVRLFERRTLRWVAGAAAAIVMLVTGFAVLNNSETIPGKVKVAKSSNWLIESTVQNPGLIPDTKISPGVENDVLMDAAANKLQKMSDKERESIYKRLAE